MSQKQFATSLVREIGKLNDQIDRKIIKGKSYSKEARRHKMLLIQLTQVTRGRELAGRYS